jgi:hypothetical protein
MPKSTCVDIPKEDQTRMLAALRRARHGSLLALHLLLLCAAGRHPTEVAAVRCCSRSSVYRAGCAPRTGPRALEHADHGRLSPPVRTTALVPTLRGSLLALLKATPHAYGWCRTRWSCATRALTWQTTRGATLCAETMRRWRQEVGWVWTHAKLVAQDNDPPRVGRLARIRYLCEPRRLAEAMVFADESEIHLVPTGGCAWMPKGPQLEVMTPGQHHTHDLAGALDVTTGRLHHCLGPRQTNALCRARLSLLEARSPADG